MDIAQLNELATVAKEREMLVDAIGLAFKDKNSLSLNSDVHHILNKMTYQQHCTPEAQRNASYRFVDMITLGMHERIKQIDVILKHHGIEPPETVNTEA